MSLLPPLSFRGPEVLLCCTRQTRRQIGESIRTADIVHLHTLWNPINVIVRRRMWSPRPTLRADAPWHA